MPDSRDWTFESEHVARTFGEHVREQLPWYDLLSQAVAFIARNYVPHGGLIYDIGASTGNLERLLRPVIEERKLEYIAVEKSRAMVERYEGQAHLLHNDVMDLELRPFDVALCFLVLMFLRPESQLELLRKLRSRLKRGGAIIVVDKFEPEGGYPAVVLSRLVLETKRLQGAAPEAILAKELSLAGVQRPLRAEILQPATEFFRYATFAGYLLEG